MKHRFLTVEFTIDRCHCLFRKEDAINMSIKEKLSKEEAVRRHRELWNKIAELCTGKFRDYEIKHVALEALGYVNPIEFPDKMCWACEYAINNAIYLHRTNEDVCCSCPIKWETASCYDKGGEYDMWTRYMRDGNYEKAAEMAKVIANLPEKED